MHSLLACVRSWRVEVKPYSPETPCARPCYGDVKVSDIYNIVRSFIKTRWKWMHVTSDCTSYGRLHLARILLRRKWGFYQRVFCRASKTNFWTQILWVTIQDAIRYTYDCLTVLRLNRAYIRWHVTKSKTFSPAAVGIFHVGKDAPIIHKFLRFCAGLW